jgi:hypothetical protein
MKPATSKKKKLSTKGIDSAILHLGIHIPATPIISTVKNKD